MIWKKQNSDKKLFFKLFRVLKNRVATSFKIPPETNKNENGLNVQGFGFSYHFYFITDIFSWKHIKLLIFLTIF